MACGCGGLCTHKGTNMNIRKLGRKIDKYRRKAQDVATFGASEEIGRRVIGNRLNAKTLIRRVVGGRNMGKKVVTPSEKNTGLPGTAAAGETACLRIDPADGSVQKPYTLIGRVQLAASAQLDQHEPGGLPRRGVGRRHRDGQRHPVRRHDRARPALHRAQ